MAKFSEANIGDHINRAPLKYQSGIQGIKTGAIRQIRIWQNLIFLGKGPINWKLQKEKSFCQGTKENKAVLLNYLIGSMINFIAKCFLKYFYSVKFLLNQNLALLFCSCLAIQIYFFFHIKIYINKLTYSNFLVYVRFPQHCTLTNIERGKNELVKKCIEKLSDIHTQFFASK